MKQKTLKLREAYELGICKLLQAGIADARVDAWWLLEYASGISRADYYGNPNREMEETVTAQYLEYLSVRAGHVPLQHITGEQEFMGLVFRVNRHVLIPRQDTETLVEAGLEVLLPGMRVLDLCTGSGCIAVSLAVHGQKAGVVAEITAADISGEALEVAEENARVHGISAKFVQSDLFEVVEGTFDLILSNPPYIRSADISELQEEVRCHDPYIALDGKADGLYFYRRIIEESSQYLTDGGRLMFEVGHDQGKMVSGLLHNAGFAQIATKKDLTGNDRVVMGMYHIQ